MDKLNSIEKAKFICDEYKDYLKSSFKFSNNDYQKSFEYQLDKESLFNGPYISLTMPFVKGKSINELIGCGQMSKGFYLFKSIDLDRPLYYHQEKTIERINKGRNVVITTGTGSGKTECFLYPVINEILKEFEEGNNDTGIRALFLYPMNALVNDQMDRLRGILKDHPDITYAYFTGDTPEKVSRDSINTTSGSGQTQTPENELLSREEIRENPPHILFTNYSMLEYLLIRPTDQRIFNREYLNSWKFIILDEAHTYSGSKAIELAFLLRRVTGFSDREQQYILTSATLGEKGKSEKEICDFASNLTSAPFSTDDIIFSNRVSLEPKLEFTITQDDIKTMYEDKKKISEISSKYIKPESENEKEVLYDLLSRDINVYKIYNYLKDDSKLFKDLHKEILDSLDEDSLIKLIDLINYSEKNGTSLFDLKYHSFVRALSGIYMSFGSDPILTLTKTNYIKGKKAFEIGNCRFCSSSYVVGKIVRSPKDGLNYLIQNDEVDIYENYGENEDYQIDYFLINNENLVLKDGDVELEEYEACAKCGEIHRLIDPNIGRCKCEKESFKLYKVHDKGNQLKSYNNISYCPCCGRSSRTGIVRTLNLGKDEGTSLISQILYRSMEKEGSVQQTTSSNKISLLGKRAISNQTEKQVKQFLAFSDSRQQASFFAVFLAHNHNRMLQKRLLWEVIKKHDYQNGLSMDVVVSELIKIIKEYDLFDNDMGLTKNAWTTVLVELLKVDGIYGGEGLGLFNFALDTNDIMERITEEDVDELLGRFGINKQDLEMLIQMCAGVFRTVPAIDITKSTMTPEDRKEVLEYRRFDNYVSFLKPLGSKRTDVHSFLPVRGSNFIERYVQKICTCSKEDADQILDTIFNNVLIGGGILKKHAMEEQYQIEADRFVLNNYKATKYYRCKKCGTVTPYNIHDKCVDDNCEGELEEIDPDVVFEKNYYRKEYINKKIERMVVKEHTAQLTREKAKQYQNDFKDKRINILSCSTTFEMGIDIGSLETVFMRNVPPTPANYVQRAGRAGRSKDSTAFILTYCNLSSHDYTYFANPAGMISGVIKPPYFEVSNEKIITRHLLAASFGFFFRKLPDYYKNIDALIFNGGIDDFRKFIASKPKDLADYIDQRVLDNNIREKYCDFKWFKNKELIDGLNVFEETIKDLMKDYTDAFTQAQIDGQGLDMVYYGKQIENIKNGRVIDNLSKYSVIPKYGFPVDVVNLQIYDENGHLDNRYDLSRDLTIAISEYAPDSEIVVDGNKYTSQYVTLPKGSELKKVYYFECEKCGRLNISHIKINEYKCEYCGNKNEVSSDDFFVEPSFGFKTGVNKESSAMKPVRSYSGDIQYIGNGVKSGSIININDQIIIETSSNDELVVRNKSNFYLCPICGFSKIDKTNLGTPYKNIPNHHNYFKRICSNAKTDLVRLGHVFKTDVAKITCRQISIYDEDHYAKALSFLYAFLEGISKSINIDRRDINGLILSNHSEGCYDILIYDDVPGGAGHVKRIADKDNIKNALEDALAKVDQDCCDEDTSCYNCLRNYYNQSFHGLLKRKYAKEVIKEMLKVFM